LTPWKFFSGSKLVLTDHYNNNNEDADMKWDWLLQAIVLRFAGIVAEQGTDQRNVARPAPTTGFVHRAMMAAEAVVALKKAVVQGEVATMVLETEEHVEAWFVMSAGFAVTYVIAVSALQLMRRFVHRVGRHQLDIMAVVVPNTDT
jgi:hypothetical protein